MFQPTDSVNEEEALQTIRILVKTIYETDEQTGDDEDIQGLARDVCDECISILKEPEKSQAKPAAKILCTFMSTTRESFFVLVKSHTYRRHTASIAKFTISQVVPHLVGLFLNPDEVGNRGPILTLLSDFISAARDSLSKMPPEPETEGGMQVELTAPPLVPYKDEVLGVLAVGLKSAPSRRPALAGLQGMVATENLLTNEELAYIVHNVNEILNADSDEIDDAR